MRSWLIGIGSFIVCWVGVVPREAGAAIDLELRPAVQSSQPGELFDVGLYAVADGGAVEQISALDVVLTWDPNVVELIQAIKSGPQFWPLFGLLSDTQLDGLNDSLADGDAYFQAASFSPVSVSPTGLLVTTLRFRAVLPGVTTLTIEPTRGRFSRTRVYPAGVVGGDVTGLLGVAQFNVNGATLSVPHLTIPVGRMGTLVVSGAINDQAFGVTVTLELVPRPQNVGLLNFTLATGPDDVDVFLLNDPWPGDGGTFTPFDTDLTGSLFLNGGLMDNGTFLPEPVTFSGPLMSFGVQAEGDALGVWDMFFDASSARWETPELVPTVLHPGTITVVDLGDGDGSGVTDVRDFSELQTCFTGVAGPIDPPVYPTGPGSRCAVYDFDDDGDVDAADYADFMDPLTVP